MYVRGQMNVVNLLYVFILLILFSVFYPLYTQVISQLNSTITDPTVKLIINLIPLAVAAGILTTVIYLGRPGGYSY